MKWYMWIVLLWFMGAQAGVAHAFQGNDQTEYSDRAKELVVESLRLFQIDKMMGQMTSAARGQTIQQLASNSTLTDAQKEISGDVTAQVFEEFEDDMIAIPMTTTLETFFEDELEAIVAF